MNDIFTNEVMAGWGEPFKFSRKQAAEFVPTWQVGQPALSGQDLANLLEEGYSKNSLIFACIEEIATSFAELPFQLLNRVGKEEQQVEEHEVLTLLDSPSETMDANEFKATLAVHHRAAGNVYIEKVRKSDNRDRQRSFAQVKELGLIRPDYVKIRPGRTREEDMFDVEVGGNLVKSLPRRDVIHWRTRNVINDFYGLSPVALLIYEGNVDTEMTKFDWAFFRNAGVPIGLLKTATKPSPDEAREIKGAFARAFNGVRKWFSILILPAKELEYQALGLPLKDMEMPETRAHVESRICAVFGVPPVLVGARVGLEAAGGLTTTSIQGSQFSFWSETMSPFANSCASVLTRELLSEYRTTQTRQARIALDLSGVKALQEDNTQRLEIAQKLIAGGGFTVNQALEHVGLPALDGGDFYVRPINVSIEAPALARNGGRAAAALVESRPAPSTWREAAYGEKQVNRTAPREKLADRATGEIEAFLTEQAARIVARLPKGRKAFDADDLVPLGEQAELLKVMQVFWDEAARQGWLLASFEVGGDDAFDPVDPRVRRLLAEAGERISGITAETRKQVQAALLEARAQGFTVRQTAELLRGLAAFSQSRAAMIARTELAIADNKGAAARYREAGVKRVQIFDGPECGWTSHDDADFANGSIRTIDEFEEFPVSHPRCVRSRAPVFED